MTTETLPELKQLQFVKLKIPRLIPRELIESVKGRTFSVDSFYEFQEAQADSPYNFLYVLIDNHKKIHGYLWAEQSMLDGSLFVNTFSITKDYWGKGKGVRLAIDFLKNLQDCKRFPRIFWITTNSRFFSKQGFRPSKQVLMEYVFDEPTPEA